MERAEQQPAFGEKPSGQVFRRAAGTQPGQDPVCGFEPFGALLGFALALEVTRGHSQRLDDLGKLPGVGLGEVAGRPGTDRDDAERIHRAAEQDTHAGTHPAILLVLRNLRLDGHC
jgi:hypothetical protein